MEKCEQHPIRINRINRRIVLIDDRQLFREGIASLCQSIGLEVIAQADNIDQLVSATRLITNLDILLIDFSQIKDDLQNSISRLAAFAPVTRIVVLANDVNLLDIWKCFSAGMGGFLGKNISSQELQKNLHLVCLGEKAFPSNLSFDVNQSVSQGVEAFLSHFSKREVQILKCLVDGDSNKKIANQLLITEATVKIHLKNILRKARATNRTQVAIWAFKQGVTHSPLHT